jgi:hypothetical protein
MARDIKHAVVLHFDADGEPTLRVWDPNGEVIVLWVDERCPGDRVYEITSREPDIGTFKDLVGSDPIGHANDGRLDDQAVQAIRAMHWRLSGGKLAATTPDIPPQGGED